MLSLRYTPLYKYLQHTLRTAQGLVVLRRVDAWLRV